MAELGADLIARWRQLQAGGANLASPFFTPEFSQAVAGCRDDLFLGLIEDGGTVTGLLPYHRRPGGRGVPVGGTVCDYQGVIGTPVPAEAAGAMLRGFRLAAYDFNHGLAEQPLLAENAFAGSVSPRADVRQGYDAWAEDVGRKGNALKTLARKERKLERELGPLRFKKHDEDPNSWKLFLEWKRDALKQMGVNFLTAGWDERLLEALRTTQLDGFEGRFSTLYAGDRMVAAHLGIATPRAWHWWFPAYAPDTGNLSVGLGLLRHCIAAAARDGIGELDFGKGAERYKAEFSNAERRLCEGSLERAGHPLGLARLLRKTVQRQAEKRVSVERAAFLRRVGNRLLAAGRL